MPSFLSWRTSKAAHGGTNKIGNAERMFGVIRLVAKGAVAIRPCSAIGTTVICAPTNGSSEVERSTAALWSAFESLEM